MGLREGVCVDQGSKPHGRAFRREALESGIAFCIARLAKRQGQPWDACGLRILLRNPLARNLAVGAVLFLRELTIHTLAAITGYGKPLRLRGLDFYQINTREMQYMRARFARKELRSNGRISARDTKQAQGGASRSEA